MNHKARIEKLEQGNNPQKYITVFEEDGKIWLGGDNIDYRHVLGGESVTYITAEQLAQLEKTHNVILVSFVDKQETDQGEELDIA